MRISIRNLFRDSYSNRYSTAGAVERAIIPLELYGDEDVLSIMIEVNKAVYADDEGFDRLKRSIGFLLGEIDSFCG